MRIWQGTGRRDYEDLAGHRKEEHSKGTKYPLMWSKQ